MFLTRVLEKKDIVRSIHFPYRAYVFGIIKQKYVNAYLNSLQPPVAPCPPFMGVELNHIDLFRITGFLDFSIILYSRN
jgi:hypothetical protein